MVNCSSWLTANKLYVKIAASLDSGIVMKFVFIMDPLVGLKAHKDTSYFLMLAAHQYSHTVHHLNQDDIFLQHDQVMATVTTVDVHENHDQPFTEHDKQQINLAEVDVIFIRTDPPFDRRYYYTTLLLDYLPATVKIVNRPQTLRDWNEKLAALYFPQFTPATLISNSVEQIGRMLEIHSKLTVKPVDGHGGQGIIFIQRDDKDWQDRVRHSTHEQSHWVVTQEYLAAAAQGDKRILLVNGEPIGGILRVHAHGVELNNLDAGGTAHACELDANDIKICAAIKSDLIKKGVFFCGIDVIGGKLIEVNVTSPTGLRELTQFSGINHHHNIIEQLEQTVITT